MPRILIVEDDRNLSRSLAQGFREHGFEVALAGTLMQARERLRADGPDLVVLDLGLPDGDGFEWLAELQRSSGGPSILISTARGELDERLRGLEGGAEDYLVKPYAFAELLARVRVLLRRRRGPAALPLRIADLEIDPVARRAVRAGRPLELTPCEFDILTQLVLAQGGVVTREMLAREVWRMRNWTASMDNVIDVHVSRLRGKLDPKGASPLLRTVRGVGFLLGEGP